MWINQQSQTVVGKGAALQLQVTEDAVGTYLCIAKVEGFPEISGAVGLFVKVRCEYVIYTFLNIFSFVKACSVINKSINELHSRSINFQINTLIIHIVIITYRIYKLIIHVN